MLRIAIVLFFSALSQSATAQVPNNHAQLADLEGEPIIVGSVHRIHSSVYGTEQIVTVRLPRGYSENPSKRYPVLFSVDGGPDQDFELLAGVAAEAELSTSFEPFILIGIHTQDRYRQLTPDMTRLQPERLRENFGGRVVPGGADQFRNYLERDVIPWATTRYRTDRKALTAASLGGLFVLDTFLQRPELFDDYIALTPSLWWDDGRIVDEAAQTLSRHGPSNRRLYFTMGDEGVGNRMGGWISSLVRIFETHAPPGLRWGFVDRSDSEEHRTMALISWLDAMRTLYATPARLGSPLSLLYDNFERPPYTPETRANLDSGPCTHANALPITFGERNLRARELFGMCVLTIAGRLPTAGNLRAGDFAQH